jgi:putative FmdB family regulatory protein
MPVYEYACAKCESEFEVEQRITEDPIKTCPRCRSRRVKRLISQTSFALKGGGWYADGYASKSGKSDGDSSKSGKSDGDSSKGGKSDGDSSSAASASDSSSSSSAATESGDKAKGKSKSKDKDKKAVA